MITKTVLFFGSFLHYSTKVLEELHRSGMIEVLGVVTTPPMPAGRDKKLTKTHTQKWAEVKDLPVFAPEKLNEKSLSLIKEKLGTKPDFMVTAGYGKLIPTSWLGLPKISPINLHFSLLPDYRGANPAEWAILMGETETGVTMIIMDEEFDTGKIITRKTALITKDDTRESLYEVLYELAGKIAVETLPHLDNVNFATKQEEGGELVYAKRLMRGNGYVDWELVGKAMAGENVALDERSGIFNRAKGAWPEILERAIRALYGYPGVWTKVSTKKGKKRMKLLGSHLENDKLLLDKVQIEGKIPSSYNEVKNLIEK
jgi:methionyl-tRNA formyltransferase